MAKFINPYNFVPLAGSAPKRGDVREEAEKDLLTGKIEYTIETLSPLFIPNTSNDKIFGIPGVDDSDDAYHKNYDFFSYHDLSGETGSKVCYEPVIPGSELRGAVRSVYEAMTNSCLSAVDENVPLSKRTVEHFKPGVLLKEFNEDGKQYEYRLYAATDYLYREKGSEDFSIHSYKKADLPLDGSHVYFNSKNNPQKDRRLFAFSISADTSVGKRNGYLIKGEPGPEIKGKMKKKAESGRNKNTSKCDKCPHFTKCNPENQIPERCYLLEKHCAHVFEIDQNKKAWTMDWQDISHRMDLLLAAYAKNNSNAYSEYRETWESFKNAVGETSGNEEIGIAVYYSIVKGKKTDGSREEICYLSPACITREVYRNTLKEILGEHRACSKPNKACPACRLFGAVNKDLMIASKIRFSDAWLKLSDHRQCETADYGDFYDEILTLPELAAPKLSSTEFYLARPDKRAINWTYDYYVLMEEGNKVSVKIDTPQIAGRKFYWHSPETAEWVRQPHVQDKIERNERNKTVRPLRKGVMFQGELYFDKITREQLNGLIRILNISALPGEKKGKYALKLGGAKPLGFGSVQMQVTEVVFRTVSFDDKGILRYRLDDSYDYKSVGLTDGICGNEVLTILDTGILKSLDMQTVKEETNRIVHYPHVKPISTNEEDKKEEGFVWFTENRIGLRYLDKRRGILSSNQENPDGSPASRTQIVYRSYMQPLDPELVENKPGDPGIGKKSYGTVTDCQKDYVRITLNDGRTVSVAIRDVKEWSKGKSIQDILPKGTRVEVTYLGKENGDDIWSCMKQKEKR